MRWTIEDVGKVIAEYPSRGAKPLAAELGRPEKSIRQLAWKTKTKRVFHARTARGKRILKLETQND